MPKDEDILQLVSPSVCVEAPVGEKKGNGAYCSTGAPRPIPGLGLLLASFEASLCSGERRRWPR